MRDKNKADISKKEVKIFKAVSIEFAALIFLLKPEYGGEVEQKQ